MKKLKKVLAVLALAAFAASFTACFIPTEEELLAGAGKDSGTRGGLWSLFDGTDIQVWGSNGNTADAKSTATGLDITIKAPEGWWGLCFCNDAKLSASSSGVITFDMSKVAKITFDAKASVSGASIWVSQSDNSAQPINQTKIELSDAFETKTFVLQNPGKNDYGVLDIGGGDLGTTVTKDVVISVKNIKFLDSKNKEIVPTRNE